MVNSGKRCNDRNQETGRWMRRRGDRRFRTISARLGLRSVLLGHGAGAKQIGEIVRAGSGGITQVRLPHVKDILHAAQVGGMREVDRAGKGLTATLAGVLRDDYLTDGVIEVVGVVASDAVLFGFVEPDHDYAVVLVGL